MYRRYNRKRQPRITSRLDRLKVIALRIIKQPRVLNVGYLVELLFKRNVIGVHFHAAYDNAQRK